MGAVSEHFSHQEMACRHCGINGARTELLTALEALRSVVGSPILIKSGWRCSAHNKAVGGATNSQHVLGKAADIVVNGMTSLRLYTMARKVPAFRGFGRNDHQNYVHVDVRATYARWCYDEQGKVVPWYV